MLKDIYFVIAHVVLRDFRKYIRHCRDRQNMPYIGCTILPAAAAEYLDYVSWIQDQNFLCDSVVVWHCAFRVCPFNRHFSTIIVRNSYTAA